VPVSGTHGMIRLESRPGGTATEERLPVTRALTMAALLLPLLAACNQPPAPVADKTIERGTALPPPGLAEAPRR